MQNVIGTRIKYLRARDRLTQRELAAKLHIGNSTLSQYENGDRVPSIDMQRKFAQHFGVSVDFLVGLTDDQTPAPERPSDELPPTNPAYLEALSYLEGLSEEGMASALSCLQAIKTLDDVKGASSGKTVILEKNA
ncbi:MAG: helix-turn-helix transcriptional regulator [Oscillospiraceae bacterium]|nr:helix-turn-helix transcriptional regulator [Oscillospiraceae bacterium]